MIDSSNLQKKFNEQIKSIPREIMELFEDVPVGALQDKVPMHKLFTMSLKEAQDLRSSLEF